MPLEEESILTPGLLLYEALHSEDGARKEQSENLRV
jgi:hypothetical protein